MTFLLETIRLGLSNLRLHMLRSFLTALGIIIGVSAVVTMVSIGEGSKAQALMQIERLGARNIIIRSQKPPQADQQGQSNQSFTSKFGLTRTDLGVIEEMFPHATAIVPLKELGSQVLRGDKRKTSQAFGTTPDMFEVAQLKLERGRYLTQADLDARAMVCVIGSEIAKEFFHLEDPVGETLRIDEKTFKVIGVLAPIGLSGGAGAALVGRDLNLDVHIPMTTARATFGDMVVRRGSGTFQASEVEVAEVYVQSAGREDVLTDADLMRRLLEVRHPKMEDIGLIVPYELLEEARRQALTWTVTLSAIAGISLLVGGIGIMNIMLANVTERTREIGIRRSLGATRKHIVWQFLVETGVLSMIGGLVGIGVGVGGSLLIGWVTPTLPTWPVIGKLVPPDVQAPIALTPWSMIVAFTVASLTGLIFGLYPAMKASKQDPIVALRHD
ncbi:MAG: ABC transporter permease [Phycisphaerales bacterium]|nr:ABC transporter permease [Phycisphaerales bacterium]MCB9836962.1 ABC transporter permease [Phycisphaera sp.]